MAQNFIALFPLEQRLFRILKSPISKPTGVNAPVDMVSLCSITKATAGISTAWLWSKCYIKISSKDYPDWLRIVQSAKQKVL